MKNTTALLMKAYSKTYVFINQTLKKMKNYTLEEIKTLNLSVNNQALITDAETESKNYNQFYPSYFLVNGGYYENSEKEQVFFIERIQHYLKSDICKIQIRKVNQHNKYYFLIYNYSDFPTLTTSEKEQIKRSLTEPQNVGVMTTKKLTNWVEYTEKKFLLYQEQENQNQSKILNFYNSLKDEKVYYWEGKKRGEIRKNGLVFSFEISNSYISTKVVVDTNRNIDIIQFNKLANNQFNT